MSLDAMFFAQMRLRKGNAEFVLLHDLSYIVHLLRPESGRKEIMIVHSKGLWLLAFWIRR